MIHKQLRRPRRNAFTLVELLVVIAIIAVLISLTSAAVMQVLVRVSETKTRNEIGQLGVAIQNFENKCGVDYVPSMFVLCETQQAYLTGMSNSNTTIAQLYTDSYNYLIRVWPRIDFTTPQPPAAPTWQGIDWNGDGLQSADVILTGDQCLVFFLGGIGGTQGFSTNGKNPAQLGGDRVTAFYEFKTSQFYQDPLHVDPTTGQLAAGWNGYFSCLDPYGKQPYLYFSSYKTQNGYNRYGSSDCPVQGVLPYFDPTNNNYYYNSTTFQIVSAGKNQLFGPGGKWVQAQAETYAPAGSSEADDMTNFYSKLMGIP